MKSKKISEAFRTLAQGCYTSAGNTSNLKFYFVGAVAAAPFSPYVSAVVMAIPTISAGSGMIYDGIAWSLEKVSPSND